MKAILGIVALILALATGGFGGFFFAKKHTEAQCLAFDASELVFYSSYWAIQLKEGADKTREEAIRAHLALIEKKKRERSSPLYTDKIAATDLAFGYARLSAIVKKRGDEKQASQLLEHAATYCPFMGWSECNGDKIVLAVQKIDELGIFGTGEM